MRPSVQKNERLSVVIVAVSKIAELNVFERQGRKSSARLPAPETENGSPILVAFLFKFQFIHILTLIYVKLGVD
jgi:hypothetical protein